MGTIFPNKDQGLPRSKHQGMSRSIDLTLMTVFLIWILCLHIVFLFQWNSSSSSFLQFLIVVGCLSSKDFIIAEFPLK
jgi:hypothetical protein